MMRFSTLLKHPVGWATSNDDSSDGIIISSKIHLVRNIEDEKFPGWSTKQERVDLHTKLRKITDEIPIFNKGFIREIPSLTLEQKQILQEKKLLSSIQANKTEGSSVLIDRKQRVSLMINEEEHLTMQAIYANLSLNEAHQALKKIQTQVEKTLPIAWSKDLGYITSSPKKIGTGMQASILMHLPALQLIEILDKVAKAAKWLDFNICNAFNQDKDLTENFVCISTQSTLGENEATMIEGLKRFALNIQQQEQSIRIELLKDNSEWLYEKISRSFGIIHYARQMEIGEALHFLSILRLGACIGMLPKKAITCINTLLFEIREGHLLHPIKKSDHSIKPAQLRAKILRERLQFYQLNSNTVTVPKPFFHCKSFSNNN